MGSSAPMFRVGIASLAIGVAAWSWELLARQVPSSSLHVQGFPNEIDRLATHAFLEAALIFALAPRAEARGFASAPTRTRVATTALIAGTVFTVGALTISARTGVLANQLVDTTAFASVLLLVRLLGDAALLVALALTAHAATRSPLQPTPPA